MTRGHFTRFTPAAGIAALGLGIGLAVAACSPGTSSAAAPPTDASAAATSPPSATAGAAINSPARTVAPPGTQAAVPSSAPATPPASAVSNANPVDAYPDKVPFVVWLCTSKPAVEPTDYVLSCGDGGNGITGAHWTSWTPSGATGTGTEYLNDCTPNCAEGKIIDYPVDISLTGSYLAAQDLPFAYAKITFTYLAARPMVYVTVNGKVELTHPATWSPPLPERPASHLTD